MKLQAQVQEALVSLLLYDDTDVGKEAAVILQPGDFDAVYSEVAAAALSYRNRFSEPPGDHAPDVFDEVCERHPKKRDLFRKLLDSVEDQRGQLNYGYFLSRAREFVRFQRLKTGMVKALQSLETGADGCVDAAEDALTEAMQVTQPVFDGGLNFFDANKSLRFLDEQESAFPTDIPELDKRNLGPARSRLHMLMAASGKGKSWWLVHLAAAAWKRNLKVLYVSCELSETEVAQRFAMRWFSVTKRKIPITYQRFIETSSPADRGTRRKVHRIDASRLLSFADENIEKKLRKKLEQMNHRVPIRIKSFPQGTLTTDQLEAFIGVLQERDSFLPDLVLVDYGDIMKLNRNLARWEALIEVTQELRRIAQKFNIAVATVSQVKHSGAGNKQVDVEDVSGAWDKIATADVVLTYSQTKEEEQVNMARLFVAKGRTEEDRFKVLISQAYGMGQFVRDSIYMGSNYETEGNAGGREW